MLNGEPAVGVSVFQVTPGLDEGDLYDQRSVDVGPDDQIGDVLQRVGEVSTAMVRERIPGVLAGTAVGRPQPSTGAKYCAARTSDDGLLDWAQPAPRLHDFIRAQARPYPGAFTWSGGRRLRVWRARQSSITAWGEPGSVVDHAGRRRLACAGGTALTARAAGRGGAGAART
jgi:methionyl-tRNA formyltransferase